MNHDPKSSVYVTNRSRTNVSLNFQGQPHDAFDLYADAYHRAGETLFETNFERQRQNDLDILPIAFLYRHAAELYLKAIVRKGNTLLALHGHPQGQIRQVHSLKQLLDDVKEVSEQSSDLSDPFLRQIAQRSQAYRRAIQTPHPQGPPWQVGKLFSELCGGGMDVSVIMYGSLEFTGTAKAVSEFLKSVTIG